MCSSFLLWIYLPKLTCFSPRCDQTLMSSSFVCLKQYHFQPSLVTSSHHLWLPAQTHNVQPSIMTSSRHSWLPAISRLQNPQLSVIHFTISTAYPPLHFIGLIPGKSGLASFIGSKDDGRGDNWSYKTCKLQSNRHHQQTNTQLSAGHMPFLSPNQQCQSTEWKT